MATPKNRNITGNEHCGSCIDGWVELAGTTKIGQTTYDRGRAPCHWCEQGLARFQRHPELESSYTGGDITPPPYDPTIRGRAFRPDTAFLRERAAAGDSIPALQAMFPRRLWPAEWTPAPPKPNPLTESEADEVAEKQRRAHLALVSAPQEPISADGEDAQNPGHAEIDLDDIPF